MAHQYQNPCSISDFHLATFSFWFRIPSSGTRSQFVAGYYDNGPSGIGAPPGFWGGIELVTWGQPTGLTYGSINLISRSPFFNEDPVNSSAASNCISAWFGQSDSVAGKNFVTWVDIYDSPGATTSFTNGWDAWRSTNHTAFLGAPFSFDTWHHLFVAADILGPDTGVGDFPGYSPNYTLTGRGRTIEIYLDTVRIHGSYLACVDNISLDNSDPSIKDPGPVNLTQLISGRELSIPTFRAYNYNPAIDYAEFQAWFGQYIDPAVHMDKFVSANKPVPTSTAAAAFGTQDLLFKGNKTAFKTNLGLAGAFTTGGSLSDFSPGP